MSSSIGTSRAGTINGRHVTAAFLAFFGIVVAVNLVMARAAVVHFTGLVVPNSYVASQQFNEKIAAHRALENMGFTEKVEARGGRLSWIVADAAGSAAAITAARIHFNRPIGTRDDVTLELVELKPGEALSVPIPSTGRWIVTINAEIPGIGAYDTVHRITISDGDMK
jgi:nitrogen fixation protein FixH